MELKKIHLGTMSFGLESLDEINFHLDVGLRELCKSGARDLHFILMSKMMSRSILALIRLSLVAAPSYQLQQQNHVEI